METYYVTDNSFKNSKVFKGFLQTNPSVGFLKIRAYTANEAIPIKGLAVTISKEIENANIVFFKGVTDESGIIEKISLPVPKIDSNNLEAPNNAKYILTASYNGKNKSYVVTMYENLYVVQTINITPNMNMEGY